MVLIIYQSRQRAEFLDFQLFGPFGFRNICRGQNVTWRWAYLFQAGTQHFPSLSESRGRDLRQYLKVGPR